MRHVDVRREVEQRPDRLRVGAALSLNALLRDCDPLDFLLFDMRGLARADRIQEHLYGY